jgi:hypothetical protein
MPTVRPLFWNILLRADRVFGSCGIHQTTVMLLQHVTTPPVQTELDNISCPFRAWFEWKKPATKAHRRPGQSPDLLPKIVAMEPDVLIRIQKWPQSQKDHRCFLKICSLLAVGSLSLQVHFSDHHASSHRNSERSLAQKIRLELLHQPTHWFKSTTTGLLGFC